MISSVEVLEVQGRFDVAQIPRLPGPLRETSNDNSRSLHPKTMDHTKDTKMAAGDERPVSDTQQDFTTHNGADHAIGLVDSIDLKTELTESFNIWSALGLQYSLTSTPLAVGSYLASVIGVGGSPTFVFGYIFAVACNLCICVSLAEIAAVHPHTSGISTPRKHA